METELQPVRQQAPEAEHQDQEDHAQSEGQVIPGLPPTDTGPQAWKFLLGSFVIEAVLWGKFSVL
jgi:hypothetical protein